METQSRRATLAMTQRTDTAGIPFPPPLVYVAGLLLGLAVQLIAPLGDLSTWIRILGGATGFAFWLVLDGAAMRRFRRADTPMIPVLPTRVLVTDGVYRHTRNPMYLGMAFLYAGIALAADLVWALLLLPLVILVIDRLVIAREEPYLERKFGEEYRSYRGRTRRWI